MTKFIDRPDYVKKLKKALLDSRSPIIGLRGPGGFGKTSILHLLESDPDVIKYFEGGFYWVVLGTEQTDASILSKLKSLISTLGGATSGMQDTYVASRELSKIVGASKSLIMIDDAWNAKDVLPFIPSTFHGKIIVTAREADAFPPGTEIFQIDGMTDQESYALLSANIAQARPETFKGLVDMVSGWPVLLALLNGRICEDISDGIPVEKSISDIERLYHDAGLRGFDINSKDQREQELTSILYHSLDRLKDDLNEKFRSLSIFPDDIQIPVSILSSYWHISREMTLEICRKFYRCSLLLEFNRSVVGSESVRLHDVVRDALRVHPDVDLVQLNSKFLQTFRPRLEGGRWASLDRSIDYLWTHLPWHLAEATQWDEYKRNFLDLEFLAKHSVYSGRRSTEDALRRISRFYPELGASLEFFERMGHLLDPLETHSDRQATIASHTASSDWPRQTHLRIDWQARELASENRPGHVGGVLCCAANDRKKLLLTGSSDTTLRTWDMESGEERSLLSGHSSWVRACAIDRSGERGISASDDGTVKYWDLSDGRLLRTFKGHAGTVRACDFSPAGDWIVSSSSDGTARIWDPANGACHHVLEGHKGAVWCARATPDGRHILTGSADCTLKLWDVETGAVERELLGHKGGVRSCDISADGRIAVSASDDRTLIVWDLSNGAIVSTLKGHMRQVRGCAIGPDGDTVVSAGGDDPRVIVWDPARSEIRAILSGHQSWVMACCFAESGRAIVSTSVDGTARIWDSASGAIKRVLPGQPTILWAGVLDGDQCAVASVTGTVHLLGFADGKVLESLPLNSGCIRDIAWDQGGRAIITVSDDTTIRRFDLEAMLAVDIGRHTAPVRACALSADATVLITGGEDGILKVWKSAAGDLKAYSFAYDIGQAGAPIQDCAIICDPSGIKALSVHSDGTAHTWDLDRREQIKTIGFGTVSLTCCATHPLRPEIVAIGGEDAKISLYDLAREAVIAEFLHNDWVSGVQFSSDGRFLGSTSDDLTLRIWDVDSAVPTAAIALRESLFGCDWSTDGKALLVVGAGGVARVSLTQIQ